MSEIVVKHSGKETMRQRICQSILIIGRGKKADLRIDDLHFSRKHAQLERHKKAFGCEI
ncbi:MAG: FHA domain-containing protein [Deltaproteobacteria bacterium]|nr:FHA domain-containing protein [Deltaproteobacteria bacterium]